MRIWCYTQNQNDHPHPHYRAPCMTYLEDYICAAPENMSWAVIVGVGGEVLVVIHGSYMRPGGLSPAVIFHAAVDVVAHYYSCRLFVCLFLVFDVVAHYHTIPALCAVSSSALGAQPVCLPRISGPAPGQGLILKG